MYASICSRRSEISDGVPEIGRIKSSIDRYEVLLNEQIRTMFGVLHLNVVLRYIISLMIEIKGVIPLPPLTITSVSCLIEKQTKVRWLTPFKYVVNYVQLIINEYNNVLQHINHPPKAINHDFHEYI
jgi:hypothetical protein